jgi:hypothetical protein
MHRMAVLPLLFVLGLVTIGLRYLPSEWDPRAPLDFAAPPNAITGLKLRWTTLQPDACFAAFSTSGMSPVRIPDGPSDVGCVVENAMRLAGSVRVTPRDPVVTCPLAAAWMLFEQHTLQPEAKRHLGTEVSAVRHLGTYACRNVNHTERGRRSQHATANAMDIAGFVLRNGREVRVAQDWAGKGAEAAFLRAVRDGACRWFRTVLGPDYNTAHRDHFHFDMGPWRVCR